MNIFLVLMAMFPLLSMASIDTVKIEKQRPNEFLDIKLFVPQIQTDVRYFSEHNFVGRRVKGYQAPICLLTKPAAVALKTVVEQLLPMGLTARVYDCYRPQTAVNDFAQWATEIDNVTMRSEFYPTIDKSKLFSEGYIAYHSGHSRGSTLYLTIVPIDSTVPAYIKGIKSVSCTAPNYSVLMIIV
ncbi:D-alanyl-D-alanine dipeptidase [Yersinia bercovieri]|nr:D-alanyl-D-alanine dipeptidase [Yersinia bercovieri]